MWNGTCADLAALLFDELLGDREAEAVALELGVAGCFPGVEAFEDVRQVFGSDAGAAVPDVEPDEAAFVAHSVFYLVKLSPEASGTVSGLLALAAMVPQIWAGIALQKKAKGSKKGWMLHLLLGVVFLILLFAHNSYADTHHEMGVYLRVYGK